MKAMQIKIEKENRKQAWGEHISDAGFKNWNDFDRRGKKYSVWTKDSINYTAKASSDVEGNLIIDLTEYN